MENVVNDGSTRLEDRLGAVADLELVIRSRALQDDVMVVRVAPGGVAGDRELPAPPHWELSVSSDRR